MLQYGWASRPMKLDKTICLMGQRRARFSTHVEDPITVTALALKNGEDCAVLVSADIAVVCAWMMEGVRGEAGRLLPDLDPMKIILSATHTHTGPTFDERWYGPLPPEVMSYEETWERFREATVEAIREAWDALAPGGLSRAFGHAVVGHNRRVRYLDGAARMYGKTGEDDFDCIEGPEDHGVDMLFLWDEAKRLSGVVVNLACPSQVTEGAGYASADFWHETRQGLRAEFGADLFVLPQCAAAGDQSPHFPLYGREEAAMRELRGVTERQEIARRLTNAVEDVVGLARGAIDDDPILRHRAERLDLPRRKITPEEYASAKKVRDELEGPLAEDPATLDTKGFQLIRARQVVERYERPEETALCATEVHAVRLGDAVMVTNPFELFLDYGHRMKARSPAEQTFVVQLACDWLGYLPTAKAVRGGHYSADALDGQLGPVGGQALVNGTLEMVGSMW